MGYCGPGCMDNRTAIFKVTIGRSPLKHGRERSRHGFTHLLIGGNRVNGRGSNVFVPEGLPHDGKVYVARYQCESEGMFQAVRVPPVRWQARPFRDGLEHAEELRAVNPSALL